MCYKVLFADSRAPPLTPYPNPATGVAINESIYTGIRVYDGVLEKGLEKLYTAASLAQLRAEIVRVLSIHPFSPLVGHAPGGRN